MHDRLRPQPRQNAPPEDAPESRPLLTVTEIGEYVSHHSCERRFKLSFNNRAEARSLPFAERLFNALDPVLQEEAKKRENEWEQSLQQSGLRNILPHENRAPDELPTWSDFLAQAALLPRDEMAYAREICIEASLGVFQARGRIDFAIVNWIDGRPRIRIVECKASRRDKTYQRIQVAAYGILARSLLNGAEIGGIAIEPSDIECVVARIDESTNEAQTILALPAFDVTQEEADIRVLTAEDGAFRRIISSDLAQLDYHLDAKCDSCVFNVHCYPESARLRKLQLIGIEPSAVRALNDGGVERIDDLAELDLAGDQARAIRSIPGFNHSLALLKQRAHARRGTLPGAPDPDTYQVEVLPNNPASQLPPHETNGQRVVRVYLTVHYDYVENRIGALSAHVTNSRGRLATPWARTTESGWQPSATVCERLETGRDANNRPTFVERDLEGQDITTFKASAWTGRYAEDTGAEREMLQEFFQKLVEAIVATAGGPSSPIHFYVWSRSEISHLVEACSRVGSGLLRHLQELLGCREPLDQLIFSCLETEVHRRFALGWTGRGLAVASSLRWFGQRFHWRRRVSNRDVDLDRLFRQDIFDFKTDLWFDGEGNWTQPRAQNSSAHKFEIRSRFFDTLTAPYWRAVWRTLPDPSTARDSKVAAAIRRYSEAASPGLFRSYLSARAHALRWIEDNIQFKNGELAKPPLELENLTQFRLDVDSTAEAAIDFLRLDQHVAATDWISFHLTPPAYRISTGRTLPLRNITCTSPGELAAEIDLTGYDIDIADLETLCTIQENSFVRFTPANADPTRGQTVNQLLRLGSTCIVNRLDWEVGTVHLWVIPLTHADRYRLLSYSHPDPGEVADYGVLDESPSDFVRVRVEARIRALATHPVCDWFNPTDPQIPLQRPLPAGAVETLTHLAESMRGADGHSLEPEQARAVVDGLRSRVQLLQGPPGTGKTMTTAGAVLVRFQARCRAGDVVILGANTHTAVNNLLDRIANLYPGYIESCRELRLRPLNVNLCKVESSATSARPEYAMSILQGMTLRQLRGLQENAVAVIGGTTGTLLKMADRFDRSDAFGRRPAGFQAAMLVVDEASMMAFPEFLALATLTSPTGEMLLSGDHRQLAPIMSHDWEQEDRPPIVLYQPYVSAYDAVRNISVRGQRAPGAILLSALSYTFRLPAVIRELISRLYRRDAIELQGRPADEESVARGPSTPWQRLWDQSSGLFLVVHEEMESTHHNPVEAEIIAQILAAAADAHLEPDSVAIITPHRAQRNLLNQQLAQFTSGQRPVGVIDTVERLQGGERPNIIVSATESDPASIASRAEFILNLNRSNVAFSRAKNRLIVVVAKSLLDHVPAEIEEYDSTLLWKSLRELCTSVIGTETVDGYGVQIFTVSSETVREEGSR